MITRRKSERRKLSGGFFYNLGRALGPTIRRGRWIWQSLTGSEEEAAKKYHGEFAVLSLPPEKSFIKHLISKLRLRLLQKEHENTDSGIRD